MHTLVNLDFCQQLAHYFNFSNTVHCFCLHFTQLFFNIAFYLCTWLTIWRYFEPEKWWVAVRKARSGITWTMLVKLLCRTSMRIHRCFITVQSSKSKDTLLPWTAGIPATNGPRWGCANPLGLWKCIFTLASEGFALARLISLDTGQSVKVLASEIRNRTLAVPCRVLLSVTPFHTVLLCASWLIKGIFGCQVQRLNGSRYYYGLVNSVMEFVNHSINWARSGQQQQRKTRISIPDTFTIYHE